LAVERADEETSAAALRTGSWLMGISAVAVVVFLVGALLALRGIIAAQRG
jgi:hypothetical protein